MPRKSTRCPKFVKIPETIATVTTSVKQSPMHSVWTNASAVEI